MVTPRALRSIPASAELPYEGKSKKLYALGREEAIMVFKDDVIAYNGKYHDTVRGKGTYSAILSSKLFELLEANGIKTHYICYMGCNRVRVRLYNVLPLEIIVRNYVYGSMSRRLPLLRKMSPIIPPLVELHYKDDKLGDPLLHPRDAVIAGLLTQEDMDELERMALRVNSVLRGFWENRELRLIDFKMEVAKSPNGFILVDELTGDSMRLVDSSGQHLDKEIYRQTRDVAGLIKAYQYLAEVAGPPTKTC
jgi:phosphoribosylaminoimidazole-succinocarboxamide synthase